MRAAALRPGARSAAGPRTVAAPPPGGRDSSCGAPPPPEATCGRGQAWEPGGRPVRPRVRSPPADRTAPNCNSLGSEARGAWGVGGTRGRNRVPAPRESSLQPASGRVRTVVVNWQPFTICAVPGFLQLSGQLSVSSLCIKTLCSGAWILRAPTGSAGRVPTDPATRAAPRLGAQRCWGPSAAVWGPDSRRVQSAPSEGIL